MDLISSDNVENEQKQKQSVGRYFSLSLYYINYTIHKESFRVCLSTIRRDNLTIEKHLVNENRKSIDETNKLDFSITLKISSFRLLRCKFTILVDSTWGLSALTPSRNLCKLGWKYFVLNWMPRYFSLIKIYSYVHILGKFICLLIIFSIRTLYFKQFYYYFHNSSWTASAQRGSASPATWETFI